MSGRCAKQHHAYLFIWHCRGLRLCLWQDGNGLILFWMEYDVLSFGTTLSAPSMGAVVQRRHHWYPSLSIVISLTLYSMLLDRWIQWRILYVSYTLRSSPHRCTASIPRSMCKVMGGKFPEHDISFVLVIETPYTARFQAWSIDEKP